MQQVFSKAFEEWERRYRSDPEQFMNDVERLLGTTPATYGDQCAVYFLALLNELAPGWNLLGVLADSQQLRADVTALQTKVNQMAVDQNSVNQKFDTLTTSLAGIRADIDALKAASAPGEPMSQENFDKLSQIAAAFATLDAENPTPAAG